MKMREEFTCPLELVHDMIKGKWKPIILWRLRLGATSLAKLERDIGGITQKMLLERFVPLSTTDEYFSVPDYGGTKRLDTKYNWTTYPACFKATKRGNGGAVP